MSMKLNEFAGIYFSLSFHRKIWNDNGAISGTMSLTFIALVVMYLSRLIHEILFALQHHHQTLIDANVLNFSLHHIYTF